MPSLSFVLKYDDFPGYTKRAFLLWFAHHCDSSLILSELYGTEAAKAFLSMYKFKHIVFIFYMNEFFESFRESSFRPKGQKTNATQIAAEFAVEPFRTQIGWEWVCPRS